MSWKRFVQDYLTFGKRDRWAALALLVIATAVFGVPKFMGSDNKMAITEDTTLLRAMDTLQKEKETFATQDENISVSFHQPTVDAGFTEGQLFNFDPNTLPAEGWQNLGLNNRTIKTIINYRSKGGRFYKKEDLKKIWGLSPAFYDRVVNYIAIESARPSYSNNYTSTTYATPKGKRDVSVVQVNSADTTELIALPGIGSKLAARIVAFRDKLGGFYATEQISETYGLTDSTFQLLKPYLQVDAAAVKKINLNTATKEELRTHPYINWALANAIVEYRAQHGAFKSLEELKNIMLIDEGTFKKITPYLSL